MKNSCPTLAKCSCYLGPGERAVSHLCPYTNSAYQLNSTLRTMKHLVLVHGLIEEQLLEVLKWKSIVLYWLLKELDTMFRSTSLTFDLSLEYRIFHFLFLSDHNGFSKILIQL